MFQTFISRHNSNFFSDKLVLTSVTPASSAPVLQTPKATSSRSEERFSRNAETDLVCRLLLEKKKDKSLCFSPDGRFLYTANGNGSCCQLDVPRLLNEG